MQLDRNVCTLIKQRVRVFAKVERNEQTNERNRENGAHLKFLLLLGGLILFSRARRQSRNNASVISHIRRFCDEVDAPLTTRGKPPSRDTFIPWISNFTVALPCSVPGTPVTLFHIFSSYPSRCPLATVESVLS